MSITSTQVSQDLQLVENFIGGQFHPIENHIQSFNPATGEVWALIPDSTETEVEAAVTAAQEAFEDWSGLDPHQRAPYLHRIADLIDARLDELALAESKDQGKPFKLAREMDIPRAAFNFRSFAGAWQHLVEGSKSSSSTGTINYTLRQPLGVAGLISPWNLPLYLLTFKIAPAIMAGNTVVCKPSEMTSVTAWMLAKICKEAELPAGVVNIVFGLGTSCGQHIIQHPKVSIVSFTGSTGVGQHIARVAAPLMKKLSLELGGKNAAIVFNDADLDRCVKGVVRSSFLNQGEICLCTSRIFVQEDVYEEFLSRFVAATRELRTGDPLDDNNFLGAVNSLVHYRKILSYVEFAKEDGGQIVVGEGVTSLNLPACNLKGWFVPPTIITGLKDSARCMQEEIFGPVVCVTTFKEEKEVVRRVNNTRYGLCASVWSENVGKIHRLGQKLDVGTVWANCWLIRNLDMPFGGLKDSGTGREGTRHSLEAYTEEKLVCIKIQ